MNTCHVLAIARFVWTEVRRARLWWLALAVVLLSSALAEFAASIAITESGDYRITFYAVTARIAAVVVMALVIEKIRKMVSRCIGFFASASA